MLEVRRGLTHAIPTIPKRPVAVEDRRTTVVAGHRSRGTACLRLLGAHRRGLALELLGETLTDRTVGHGAIEVGQHELGQGLGLLISAM